MIVRTKGRTYDLPIVSRMHYEVAHTHSGTHVRGQILGCIGYSIYERVGGAVKRMCPSVS